MTLSLAAPQWLWLALPAIGITLLLTWAARHRLSRRRRAFALAIRIVVIAALVLAVAGLQIVLPVNKLTTVFVVDLSDSVGAEGRESALAFVREAIEAAPAEDQAGIVAFGGQALVERLPSTTRVLDAFESVPVTTATDIGAALRLAAAIFPDAAQKRLVLVSDGNDTTGRGQSEAAVAAGQGIQVETHVIGRAASEEFLVERLHTPTTAREGEEIEVEVTIRSSVRQPASLRLFGDGKQIAEQQVTLEEGSNRFVFATRATEPGFHSFRVRVEAAADTFVQNNLASSNTIVKGSPRTLVIAGDSAIAENLVSALRAERQNVTLQRPAQAPRDLAGLATYDSIVLVDTPAERLTEDQMRAMQVYTRDLGRGLVMVGGPQSYGAGGYRRTPLEDVLPVEMSVRNRTKQPDVALVVVLDKSGSMAACHCNTLPGDVTGEIAKIQKVDIGKEAIVRAVAALTQQDEFGVVAFDENAHWVIRTAPLGQIGDVGAQIGGIRPDGQTNIFAGLSEAVDSLEKSKATRRHVILLTDGWSRSGQWDAILARMRAAGITLSTVGAGGGSDDILADFAKRGGGRYYNAENVASIPDIFLKETQQVSGQLIVEEPFFPIQTSTSPILKGLEKGLPRLLGYNGTTAKAAAQTVLVSTRDDPVLAQWQYGLGRSVAWTSDATGRWAKNWVGWPGFNRFFSQLVAWTFPGEETSGIEAEFVTQGEQTRLRLQSLEQDGSPRNLYETVVTIVAPDLESHTVRLQQSAPGVYEAPLGNLEPGAYALRVIQTKPGATALGRTLGLVAPTAAEYHLLGTNERLLASLRAATGGREIADPKDAWRHDLRSTSFATDLWPFLLLLALLLWPLDVAVRRVSVSRRELVMARAWIRERAGRGAAAQPAAVGALLAAKERAGAERSRAALLRRPGSPPLPANGPVASPSPQTTSSSQPKATPPATDEPTEATGAADSPAGDTLSRLQQAKRRARR
jgi:Ca-activated chloride channel family protein